MRSNQVDRILSESAFINKNEFPNSEKNHAFQPLLCISKLNSVIMNSLGTVNMLVVTVASLQL